MADHPVERKADLKIVRLPIQTPEGIHVPLVIPADTDWSPDRCRHMTTEISESERRLYCRECGVEVDPIAFLVQMAHGELRQTSQVEAILEYRQKEYDQAKRDKARRALTPRDRAINRHRQAVSDQRMAWMLYESTRVEVFRRLTTEGIGARRSIRGLWTRLEDRQTQANRAAERLDEAEAALARFPVPEIAS